MINVYMFFPIKPVFIPNTFTLTKPDHGFWEFPAKAYDAFDGCRTVLSGLAEFVLSKPLTVYLLLFGFHFLLQNAASCHKLGLQGSPMIEMFGFSLHDEYITYMCLITTGTT